MIEVLLILVALALVVACGAFVAAEFAFVTVDRPSVERAAEEGDKKAAGIRFCRLPAAYRSLGGRVAVLRSIGRRS